MLSLKHICLPSSAFEIVRPDGDSVADAVPLGLLATYTGVAVWQAILVFIYELSQDHVASNWQR